MNHIYKSVWNEHTGAYVAVSETTKTKGKRSGSILTKTVAAGILSFCITGGVANAQSNPNINNVSNLSTTAALSPVLGIVGGLTGSQGATATNLLGGVLDPVLGVVGGLTGGQASGSALGGLLDPVLGLVGGLTGGNGGLLGGGSAGTGAITDVQGTVGRLVNNTALTPVGSLVNGLVDPQTGALAPVTGLVNDLTSASGPLAPVGGLVNGLVGDQGALTPVVGTVNNLLGGLTGGLTGGTQGGPLDPVLGLLGGLTGGQAGSGTGGLLDPVLGLVGGLTGGNGGLLGGGSAGTGAITDVQGTVGRLVNNTALTPVGSLVNGLVDPQTGALAPVTGLVNDLTSASGPLAPVGGLVNGLVGDQGALTPVVGTVNNLLGSLTGGGQSGGLLDGLLGGGQSGGLLGGLLGGGQSGGQSGGLLGGLLGGGQGGGLLGGLLGGGQSGGQSGGLLGGLLGGGQGGGLLGGLLGGGQGGSGSVLDLSTGIVLPQNQLGNTLDTVLTPILKPVEGLVNSLLGALSPVLNPVLGVVNGITGGLGIELPKDLHLDLVDDLSLALQGKQPLDLSLLGSDGNILGLITPAAAPNPGTPIPAPAVGEIAIGGGEVNGLGTGAIATANGAGAIAIGDGANANGALTTALGTGAAATAEATVALGGAASAAKAGGTAVGAGSSAAGEGATALGLGALATVNNAVAVGSLAKATATNAVALGTGSIADEVNTVSVGSAGNERRITNVANGTKASDAATVGQLTPVVNALGGGAVVAANGTVTGPTYNGFSDASQSFNNVGSALYYLDARVTDLENNGVGGNNLVQQDATSRDITVGKETDGTKVNFANNASQARKLAGVAAGAVTNTSTEAINGTQLHATQKAIADALGAGTTIVNNLDGSVIITPTYNINEVTQGGIVNNSYNNVGDAFNSVSNSVTNLYNQVNDGKIGLVQQASPNAAITVGKSTGGSEVDFRNESGDARRLTGVAEAVEGTDAVNLDQVTRMVQGATPVDLTEVRNDISSLRSDVRRVEKRADAGAATAMAVAGLPQAYMPGKSMVSMSGGVYASESGYALGASTVTENGKWVIKGSVAGSSRGQMGATIGAGYQW